MQNEKEIYDLGRLFNVLLSRIAANALCLGTITNEKNNFNVKSYNIIDNLKYFHAPLTFEFLKPFFKDLLKGAALRNGIEDFEMLLCHIYPLLVEIRKEKKGSLSNKDFGKLGFNKKLEKIDILMDGKLKKHAGFWQSMQHMRTAIVHYGSIVNRDNITIYIPGIEIYATIGENKVKLPMHIVNDFSSGAKKIEIKFIQIIKILHCGDKVEFSDEEISWLLIGLHNSILNLQRLFIEIALSNGMPVQYADMDKPFKTLGDLLYYESSKNIIRLE